jgi:hypothetical protein
MTAKQVLPDVAGAGAGNQDAVQKKSRCLYSVFSGLPGICSPTARGFFDLCCWKLNCIGAVSRPSWMSADFFFFYSASKIYYYVRRPLALIGDLILTSNASFMVRGCHTVP